jgi:hypothetical protein
VTGTKSVTSFKPRRSPTGTGCSRRRLWEYRTGWCRRSDAPLRRLMAATRATSSSPSPCTLIWPIQQ